MDKTADMTRKQQVIKFLSWSIGDANIDEWHTVSAWLGWASEEVAIIIEENKAKEKAQ